MATSKLIFALSTFSIAAGVHGLAGCFCSSSPFIKGVSLLFFTKYISSFLLILMGSMDCLTTVVGTLYYGTGELNPLIASLISTSLPAFVLVKLIVTVSIGLIFVFAEKTLMKTLNKGTQAFRATYGFMRVAFLGIVFFLAIVVGNNIVVIIRAIR